MKCLNKKVTAYKNTLQSQRAQEAEEARWNSLTPEEQEKELAERESKMQTGMRALRDLQKIKTYIGGPY